MTLPTVKGSFIAPKDFMPCHKRKDILSNSHCILAYIYDLYINKSIKRYIYIQYIWDHHHNSGPFFKTNPKQTVDFSDAV